MRRQPATEQIEVEPAMGASAKDPSGVCYRRTPGLRIGLLRAHMKRHASRAQTELIRCDQEIGRHMGLAAEFARQRPFGTFVFDQQTAEDTRTRRATGQLLELRSAVKGVKADASGRRARNSALALDRIAEGEPLGRNIQAQAYVELTAARQIEIGAESRKGGDDVRGRVYLDRIIDSADGNARRKTS